MQPLLKGNANHSQYKIKIVFIFIVVMQAYFFKGSANHAQYKIKLLFFFIVVMQPTYLKVVQIMHNIKY